MTSTNRLWRWLGLIFVLSFGALGFLGWQIHLQAPPIPAAVKTADGRVLWTGEQIQRGQQVWLSAGGQQLGTVWGHGSYVAPDWSADWLHREATTLLGIVHNDFELKSQMRTNRYDAATGTVTVSAERAQAIEQTATHFEQLFGNEASLATLRTQYAMGEGLVPAAEDRRALAGFFFWSAWAASTDRPGETNLSYTSNWPHEPLVGNTLTGNAAMWSMA